MDWQALASSQCLQSSRPESESNQSDCEMACAQTWVMV
jgi:hypothetical protein